MDSLWAKTLRPERSWTMVHPSLLLRRCRWRRPAILPLAKVRTGTQVPIRQRGFLHLTLHLTFHLTKPLREHLTEALDSATHSGSTHGMSESTAPF